MLNVEFLSEKNMAELDPRIAKHFHLIGANDWEQYFIIKNAQNQKRGKIDAQIGERLNKIGLGWKKKAADYRSSLEMR